jgi:hypothetical protein
VFFLIKCAVCIALVILALQLRDADAPASTRAPADAHARIAPPKPPKRPALEDTARDMAQAGADALVAAARERCLSAPRDCVAMLKKLQGQGH